MSSIFGVHNETGKNTLQTHDLAPDSDVVNIHSHLIGSILFFTLPIPVYNSLRPKYISATTADIAVFSTFFFGVAVCFALSAS